MEIKLLRVKDLKKVIRLENAYRHIHKKHKTCINITKRIILKRQMNRIKQIQNLIYAKYND